VFSGERAEGREQVGSKCPGEITTGAASRSGALQNRAEISARRRRSEPGICPSPWKRHRACAAVGEGYYVEVPTGWDKNSTVEP
jgi:hypothetical protein